MPGRSFNSNDYRYGFNGKEKDENGEFGSNTTYDYGFRIYNPALGKFLSVDPLTASYPWYTPYQFAGNSPIANLDIDGLEEIYYDLIFDKKGGTTLKKVDEEDTWYLPDLIKVHVPSLGVSYTFSKWAPSGNQYNDFKAFQKDPESAILSGKYYTDGQLIPGPSEVAQELLLAFLLRRALKSGKPYKPKRLPQDAKLGLNKRAPIALPTQGRKISKNVNQNKAVQDRVSQLKEAGATDIRIDQQQVDANGNHVGINRPDLQYTLDGKRHYVEWDTKSSGRGPGHEARIRANDSSAGSVELIILD